jgi:hypothetical protein
MPNCGGAVSTCNGSKKLIDHRTTNPHKCDLKYKLTSAAARNLDRPANPLPPQRCTETRRPLGLDHEQPRLIHRATSGTEGEPTAADARGTRSNHHDRSGRRRLGNSCLGLAMTTGSRRAELCALP